MPKDCEGIIYGCPYVNKCDGKPDISVESFDNMLSSPVYFWHVAKSIGRSDRLWITKKDEIQSFYHCYPKGRGSSFYKRDIDTLTSTMTSGVRRIVLSKVEGLLNDIANMDEIKIEGEKWNKKLMK